MEHVKEALDSFHEGRTIPSLKIPGIEEVASSQAEKEQEFIRRARIPSLDHTFERFDQGWKGTEKAFAAAKAVGEGTTDQPFLLIYGGTGNGKTYLIEAIIIALGRRGIFTRYWTAAECFDYLKEGIKVEYGQLDVSARTKYLSEAKTLVLDDLGIEYGTDWEWSRLEMIIDYRYRFRNITIITTNKDIVGKMEGNKYVPGLQDKSERILSRFSDPDVAQLVLNKGLDYRQREG